MIRFPENESVTGCKLSSTTSPSHRTPSRRTGRSPTLTSRISAPFNAGCRYAAFRLSISTSSSVGSSRKSPSKYVPPTVTRSGPRGMMYPGIVSENGASIMVIDATTSFGRANSATTPRPGSICEASPRTAISAAKSPAQLTTASGGAPISLAPVSSASAAEATAQSRSTTARGCARSSSTRLSRYGSARHTTTLARSAPHSPSGSAFPSPIPSSASLPTRSL
mmetsp:Transcript_10727/g.26935  ORF Transcript_10727/g.26935 Transcript_10727/m.26935 type:complete len:223 (+) Transcript_10727:531-1199(+)